MSGNGRAMALSVGRGECEICDMMFGESRAGSASRPDALKRIVKPTGRERAYRACALRDRASHCKRRDSEEKMMDIKDVMTRNPHTVTPDATIQEAAQIMAREDVGIVPVVENNEHHRLVGVITDRDIAVRCVAEGRGADCRVS